MAVIPRAIEALSGEMNTFESADVRSIVNDSILHRKGRIGKSELGLPSSALFPVSCFVFPVSCLLFPVSCRLLSPSSLVPYCVDRGEAGDAAG